MTTRPSLAQTSGRLSDVSTWLAEVAGRAERTIEVSVRTRAAPDEVPASGLVRRLRAAGLTVEVPLAAQHGPTTQRLLVTAPGHAQTSPRSDGDQPQPVDADVVIDCTDTGWPVIRHVADWVGWSDQARLRETQAFFAVRAATWDAKFGDDMPAYDAAVRESAFTVGGVVADVGCGTGRALPALRSAVGPGGAVLGIDVTVEMLMAARDHGRGTGVALLLADAGRLPLADASLDGVFAAGLVSHMHAPEAGLRELGRVMRPNGVLALFHPSGRATLAARHGRTLEPHEPLAPGRLGPLLHATGWRMHRYDDADHRFFATATRTAP